MKGLRVLDLSRIIAGPYAAVLLGDLGPTSSRSSARGAATTCAGCAAARDGYLNVVLTGPDQYGRFCEGLGAPELFAHPKFAANDDRLAHHAEFKARVEERLATATTAEWVERFGRARWRWGRSTSSTRCSRILT